MKANSRTVHVACLILMTLAWAGGSLAASPPGVRVDAVVEPHQVRIEARGTGPFEYTSYRPSDTLFVVDLAGVSASMPSTARVLDSALVSSYRVLQYRAGERAIVRVEILLRAPAEPRIERLAPDHVVVTIPEAARPDAIGARASKPEMPAAVPRVSAAKSPAGNLIQHVRVARNADQTQVRVEGNGRLTYETMRLLQPERLVLDFSGARIRMAEKAIPSSLDPVRGIRVGQFKPDVARVVIELDRGMPYSVSVTDSAVIVAFGSARAAALPAPPVHAPVVAQPAREVSHAPAATETSQPEAARGMVISLPLAMTEPTALLAVPAAAKLSVPDISKDKETETPPAPAQAQAQKPAAPAPAPQMGARYSGEPVSVNLKDVDLKDFFRLIHEISGLNVVLDPTVRGSLTIVLDDVPWDQALDIVLRNNNLDKQLEGNVLRVATKSELKKEADDSRDLIKAQEQAIPVETTTRALSYAKATSMRDTLKRFLSSRGEILADERSNTLIIRDIPSVIPPIDILIKELDKKTQQVEIEARVVLATRSFARDIGTQFGFTTTSTGGRTVWGGLVGNNSFVSPVQRGPGLPTPPLVASTNNQIPLQTNLGATAPTSGTTFAHSSPNLALDFIISASESRGVGKLLSKPKIITQNNEKAHVLQGTKIPVQTVINNTVTTQFIEAVLKLEVTPQITAEGTVFMELKVENTSIDTGIPRVQGIPALATQEALTKVLITDGGTVVIGGVIVSSQSTTISQVPLFGSIPLIGHLFKKTAVSTDSKELLFFLTPRIIPS